MSEVAVIPQDAFNVAKLSEMVLPETFENALATLREIGVHVDNAGAVLADDFPLVDKAKLINVPFLLLSWTVSRPGEGDNGAQYIVCRGITKDNRRFRFADGSTGIYAQLVKLTRSRLDEGNSNGANAGLLVPAGLTKSDYTFTDDKGKTQPATTYYLSNEE